MPVLRPHSRPAPLATRPASSDDLAVVLRLIDYAEHRLVSVAHGEIAGLLAGAPALLLLDGGVPCGVVVAGWPHETIVWQRVLALSSGLPAPRALNILLPPFHDLLRARGIARVYISSDGASDTWAWPALHSLGYAHDTDVIVYEKTRMNAPTRGNTAVRVRAATSADIPAILAVDAHCFSPEWRKDDVQIGIALHEAPRFFVAEEHDAVIGYAFVTGHYGGRLVHLVRIAVQPERQGNGIGARLLYEVTDYAAATGADILTLNTQAYNRSARRLYEWFGFRRTGEKQSVLRYDL